MLFISNADADVSCTISDYQVDAYDHGGTYLHGNVGGTWKNFIQLCGNTGCNDQATNRRLSIAMTGQVSGKTLDAYFVGFNTCADITNYSRPASVKLN